MLSENFSTVCELDLIDTFKNNRSEFQVKFQQMTNSKVVSYFYERGELSEKYSLWEFGQYSSEVEKEEPDSFLVYHYLI